MCAYEHIERIDSLFWLAAFFVGKNELLNWLNELLQLSYTKVEQCANGAAYCQIMDAVYPVCLVLLSLFIFLVETLDAGGSAFKESPF